MAFWLFAVLIVVFFCAQIISVEYVPAHLEYVPPGISVTAKVGIKSVLKGFGERLATLHDSVQIVVLTAGLVLFAFA